MTWTPFFAVVGMLTCAYWAACVGLFVVMMIIHLLDL